MQMLYSFLTGSIFLCLTSNSVPAQRSLSPSDSAEPLFQTLREVRPATPISSLPFNILTSGSYYLTTNLTGIPGTNGITIKADCVSLDLMSFTVAGVSDSFDGIAVIGERRNITVRNGIARNWGGRGVNLIRARSGVLEGLRALNNAAAGLATGPKSVVTACVALTNGTDGLQVGAGSVVRECIAKANGGNGIVTSNDTLVTQCTALWNGHNGLVGVGGCYLLNNFAAENGSATTNASGIFMAGTGGGRIDGNVLANNKNAGLRLQGSDHLVIRNSSRGHPNNYLISNGNSFGATNNVSGLVDDTGPWRNFSF